MATESGTAVAASREDPGSCAGGASVEGLACPAILNVDELATLLRLNRKTVYAMIQRGEIPGVRRLGRIVRIHRDTVLHWLAEGQGRVSRSRRNR